MPSKVRSEPSVLFINRVYPPLRGATGRVLRELAREMASRGWKVVVLTAASEARVQKDGGVEVIRVKAPANARTGFSALRVWIRLFRAAMDVPRPDLVVTLTDPPMLVLVGRALQMFRKTRHLHWCHDLYPDLVPALNGNLGRPLYGLLSFLSRRAMCRANRIIAIGRCMARLLVGKGIDPRRVSVIPNWPDAELADSTLRASWKRRRIRKTTGIRAFCDLFKDEQPKFRVLYAGNLGRAHPVQSILDAAAMLVDDYPEIEFVFVGDGPGQDRLAQERASRGLHNIRLMPFQPADKLRSLLESGDVHLVSMCHEASGMLVPCKLYSAFAVKRPCVFVGPVHSEAAKVINDFKAGAVIPQGQPAMLAQTIRHFREDGDMWFSAQKGAIEAGRVFTMEGSIGAWIERAADVVRGREI